jgi:predicted nucleotidyltransferase
MRLSPDLPVLSAVERSCLDRYVELLAETLGVQLLEVLVYGSVARGETWPAGMPIRSDLDLLVVTEKPVSTETVTAVVEATMPLFLESGRQLAPAFRTRGELADARGERMSEFVAQLRRDGVPIYTR